MQKCTQESNKKNIGTEDTKDLKKTTRLETRLRKMTAEKWKSRNLIVAELAHNFLIY